MIANAFTECNRLVSGGLRSMDPLLVLILGKFERSNAAFHGGDNPWFLFIVWTWQQANRH